MRASPSSLGPGPVATRHSSVRRGGPSARRRAFTVIELLVAATITAVLAGFIVAIVSNVSGFWNRTTGKLSTEAQARLVLDQIALDLSSAIYRDDGHVWLAADVINRANGLNTTNSLWQVATANPKPVGGLSLAMNAAKLTDARYGNGGVWLRFFTTKRGANSTATATASTNPTTYSAPVAVGYQIIRRLSTPSTTNPARTGYLLHRAEVRPAASGTRPGVMESGYDITAAAYTTSTATTNNGATTGDPRSIQVPGSRTNFSSVIADNVVDFGIRCYVREPTPVTDTTTTAQPDRLRVIFPAADETGALSNSATVQLRSQLPGNTPADSTNYNQLFPDVVDVMVRVLTDEGVRLLAQYEQANSPLTLPTGVNAQQYWWQIVTANSQVFTRRIVLTAKPL
ncbi:MAG: prepilin-type N-terminal cleavage/methylation domain-containing protein [Verrucomicrobia bacterium]|nr:prepilin-type N-terminal cleavage/methylation domain-containing protein [Verrucomicrobiota bacterium]